MSYPVELKETLQKRLENGEKPKKISEETGISIPTLYNWKRELEEKKILNSKTKNIIQTSEEIGASIQIKRLIKLNKLEEAYQLTLKYPNNKIIQSQQITILILQEKYKEAKYLCTQKENQSNPLIQSQLITVLIRENNPEVAEKICKKAIFKNSEDIQSQYINILKQQGEEGKQNAEKIYKRRVFKDSEIIQSQKLKMLIEENKFEEAKQLCRKENFQNSVSIQSQLMTILIAEGKIGEAKKIAYQEIFKKEDIIQSQLITILRREGNKEQAIGIAKSFHESIPIQLQLMGILIDINTPNSIEELKSIGQKQLFSNAESIQLRLARQYVREENYIGAKEICQREIFTKFIPMQKLLERIRLEERNNLEREEGLLKEDKSWIEKTIETKNLSNQPQEKGKTEQIEKTKKVEEVKKNKTPESKKQQVEPTIMKKKTKINKTAKKNKFKEGLQYQVQPLQTKDVHKFSMKELKEMRNDIYVRMQSEDIQVHKKAVEQWDKMERLLDKMKRERKDYLEL